MESDLWSAVFCTLTSGKSGLISLLVPRWWKDPPSRGATWTGDKRKWFFEGFTPLLAHPIPQRPSRLLSH